MIVVRNITVYTLSRDSLSLKWNIETTSEDTSGYTLTILRSNSEVGPYAAASSAFAADSASSFTDTGVNLFSKNRKYYYQIKVIKTSNSDTTTYGSTSVEKIFQGAHPGGVHLKAFPDLDALEAIRRFDVLLKEYIGRQVIVMNRRSTGTRCTECWDPLKRRRLKSICTTCYSTGIVGGYFSPRVAYAASPSTSETNALTNLFEMEPKDSVKLFSSTPLISPKDLVIDSENRRFRVIANQFSGKLSAVTRQTVHMRELSKDQVEFQISVSGWDIDAIDASPLRQYIKSSDIHSYRAAASALGKEG